MMNTQTKTQQQCQSTSRLSSSWGSLWRELFSHARTSQLNQVVVHARLAIHAILLAATSNRRTFLGLAFIASGPLIEVAYRLFNESGGDPLSYWNAYHFLFAVRSDMSTILYATGFYLLMSEFSRVKLIAIVPTAYKLARIIWMLFVTNNTQYHAFVPVQFLLYGFSIGLAWLFMFEWMMSLTFHKIAGCWNRIEGILSAPGIDNDTRVAIAQKELETLKSLK